MKEKSDSEKVLLTLLRHNILGLKGNIDAYHQNEEPQIAGGLNQAMRSLQAALRLYKAYCDGKIPEHMSDEYLFQYSQYDYDKELINLIEC